MIETVTHNLNASVRQGTLHGRTYLVVPVVMLTTGVHNGSNGPLFYPPDELAKTPTIWNLKPIVVYHPGTGTTATSLAELTARQVGMIMNTRYDGKLRAEAWLDPDRLRAVDPRVLAAVENGTVLEVSTGVYTDNQYAPGTWKGQEYELVARNYRPDHLAILPDKFGACRVADGCGLLQLNANPENVMTQDVTPLVVPNDGHPDETPEGRAAVANAVAEARHLPLPTMNFDQPDGCCDKPHPAGDGPTPDPTSNASDGADSGLPLPDMGW